MCVQVTGIRNTSRSARALGRRDRRDAGTGGGGGDLVLRSGEEEAVEAPPAEECERRWGRGDGVAVLEVTLIDASSGGGSSPANASCRAPMA